MRVVIAGGHGKIALNLEQLLTQRGDSVAGFIRNPGHAADLQAGGAQPLVVDLENATVDEVASHLEGADAVVFAAGAGPGSGAARKETVDRDAAILLADAAEAAGVDRYLMISAMAADPQATDDDPAGGGGGAGGLGRVYDDPGAGRRPAAPRRRSGIRGIPARERGCRRRDP